jgi:hypothetical protein
MSQTNNDNLDDASNGGGIGDIPRQPVDPSSQNPGNGEPLILPDDDDGVGAVDDDGLDSGHDVITVEDDEDPDDDADSTQGMPS